MYEPLWDELYERLKSRGIAINSIWIADVAQQGASGVLNEAKLGNDREYFSVFSNDLYLHATASWMDHPRDLFLMVNHFRAHMKRPIIGIGHSMGGNNLINLSLMHPRLFTSLILLDPVIQRVPSLNGNFTPAKMSTKRRDRWPNRAAAEASFKRSKFYQTWDPRVLDLWIKHGLRDLPTPLYPGAAPASSSPPILSPDPSLATIQPKPSTDIEVTLTTTKHQEVLTFLRPNFTTLANNNIPNPLTHPDLDVLSLPPTPFYRPEPQATFLRLPHVRPSVFYIFGETSNLSAPHLKADKLAQTGIGVGGSGGVKKGRVESVTFKGVGHLIPMEVVGETAEACAGWVGKEVWRWRGMESEERREWKRVERGEKSRLSREYVEKISGDWMDGTKKAKL